MRRAAIGACLGILWAASALPARTYYVNNLIGRAGNDGHSPELLSLLTGPVKTINQALKFAGSGDTIIIVNTGVPYYESFTLSGIRLGGIPRVPLIIQGNGATLSGLRIAPPQGWRRLRNDLWEVSFNRKGSYRLLRDGFSVPEHRIEGPGNPVDTLPVGQWTGYRGNVFFHAAPGDDPPLDRFDYAAGEMGVTLYEVENVRIVDLTVQHFRVDGINAFNQCQGIELENVTCRENGRAGLAAGGTSRVVFRGGRLEGNGRDAALVTGKALISIEESQLDHEPTVRP